MKNEILEIGKVVNTHGIRGELKIQPWCDDPAIFDELEYIYIGGKKYNITRSRFHKTCEIVAVEGINNINEAELLKLIRPRTTTKISAINASMKFESGPASAVNAIPPFLCLKFHGFMGTGFAQPKPKRKRHSAPKGSRWCSGLSDSLPVLLAVLSPIA